MVMQPQQICVSNENDVIAMRQEVRHMARSVGLGLIEQAKIATAISAIARMFLEEDGGTEVTMRMIGMGEQSALEIACIPPCGASSEEMAHMEERLLLTNARLLVDEAKLSQDANHLVLTLRMRLMRPTRV